MLAYIAVCAIFPPQAKRLFISSSDLFIIFATACIVIPLLIIALTIAFTCFFCSLSWASASANLTVFSLSWTFCSLSWTFCSFSWAFCSFSWAFFSFSWAFF